MPGKENIRTEVEEKNNCIRQLLVSKNLDAVLLQRFSSVAWATGGADTHINTASSIGEASLLITPNDHFLFTNNIEAGRLENEEGLGNQGWQFKVTPWYSNQTALVDYLEGKKVGHDGLFSSGVNLSVELVWLRTQLTRNEVDRFRTLGKLCGQIMNEAVRAIKPGMTELEAAALLSQSAESRGVQAVVNLVASDERIFKFRHPLPTSKKIESYAMLILCGRKWGLICSITRLVHFGPLTDELAAKAEAVAQIDAEMIAATRPGNTLADVLDVARNGYSQYGYEGEWKNHHQGGLAGYEPREITATPDTHQPVQINQVYAWNPSIAGSKSEDTILVAETGNEILTEIPGWPVKEVEIENRLIERPAVLVKD